MIEARNAAKAFIVKNGKLLIVKRDPANVQKPGTWEIPGGRLEIGENPYDGLKRELIEETGLDIETICPINVRHFTRTDGQIVTLFIFLCKPLTEKITLSSEHTDYEWIEVDKAREKINPFFLPEIENYKKMGLEKLTK
jgi:8-oxo-dGTP diphosphatase